ncbi:MAG TPA: TonB-dependent receptor, partial [Pyrinomonadaceae bacterium]|nr:TonB-dependent receptor [Pyrinomonadaceae bacterium]
IFQVQKDGELREDTGSVKIDWLHSEKSQFSARYNINDSKTTTPYGVGTDQLADGTLRIQLFKFSHNYTFSPNVVNEAAFGINHNKTHPGAGPSTLPIVSFLFGDQAVANPGPAQFNQFRTGVVYNFLDTLTFVNGNHTFKAGADIRLNRRKAESVVQDTMQYLGLVDASTLDLFNNLPFIISRGGHPELEFANENFSFFFQDDWKVHPRWTLNLGLRYDVSTVSREKDGRLQNFDPDTLTYSAIGEKVHNVDTNNFGPRLGFAFDVFGNQKTVLRGGYGIFFNRELPASWGSPHVNTFPTQSVDFFGYLNCAFGPPFTTAGFGFPIDPQLFEDCAVPSAMSINRDWKTTNAHHWSLNVQQDLGIGTLQVGYVGNRVKDILTDGVVTPRNINRSNEGRPLSSAFGDVFDVGFYPTSQYHAMQVTFKRNWSKGVRFNANYTWGHAIDDIVGFFKDYQDPNNIAAERASSDQDVRHNFTLDAGYDLPLRDWFGGGPRWLVDGWNLSSITQFRSGLPVNVNLTGGTFGGFSFRPDVVPGVDPYDSHATLPNGTVCNGYSLPDCQFNPAAFTPPPPGRLYGNAGRNLLRGPGFKQVDFSIFKNTKFTETKSLQLRVDIFNLLNWVNFADPSGGLVQADVNSLRPGGFFGQSTATVGNQLGGLLGFGGPRQIQLSARFNF